MLQSVEDCLSLEQQWALSGPDYAAPAKLNLFLHVTGRRADGYHLLQTAFRFLDYGDLLRFEVRTDGRIERVNSLIGVAPDDDLVVRAAKALRSATGTTHGANIELMKRLPIGGGVGGGSSDAATTLLALNHLWKTKLSCERLMEIGLGLGADVPVFIYGRSSWAEGVGECLQAIELPSAWYLVLVPPVSVSTEEIFRDPHLTRTTKPIKLTPFSAIQVVLNDSHNDLEPVAVKRYSEIAAHLEWLRQFGNARMTGSGCCVFSAFSDEKSARNALNLLPPSMKGFVAKGCDRHPLAELVGS